MTKYIQGTLKQVLSEGKQAQNLILSVEDDLGLTDGKRKGGKFDAGSIQHNIVLIGMLMIHYEGVELRYINQGGGNGYDPLKGLLHALGRWENGFINRGGISTLLKNTVCKDEVEGKFSTKASVVMGWLFNAVSKSEQPSITLLDPFFTVEVTRNNRSALQLLHAVYSIVFAAGEDSPNQADFINMVKLFNTTRG